MIDPKVLRPVYLQNISAPAVILPLDEYDQPFVVFGAGDAAIACFIGSLHRFETMPAVSNDNWKGFAIENLSIEVDLESAVGTQGRAAPTGSLVRTGSRLELMAIGKPRSFRDRVKLLVEDDLPPGDEDLAVAFTRWWLVKREGDRVIFKHEIIAGEPQQPD